MPPEEHAELITAGWPAEVVNSLRARGFRPVKPSATDLRSGDATARTMGFLRQGILPHLHITVERTGNTEDLLRDIDTAIDAAAYRAGHAALAALFTRFTDAVKSPIARLPAPDLTALEARLKALEAKASTITDAHGYRGLECPHCAFTASTGDRGLDFRLLGTHECKPSKPLKPA